MKKPSSVSVHESAHAITAHVLGDKVKSISVDGNRTGCTEIYHTKDMVVRTAILIAGHEAEVLWYKADLTKFPANDFMNLNKIGSYPIGSNIVRPDLRKFLKGNKSVIFHIARILDKKQYISRRIFVREFNKIYKN